MVHEGSGFAVAECKGRRQGKAVCEAQITYRVMAFPSPEFRKALLEWAERIDLPVNELAAEPHQ
jgi:3-hydroxyacyl-[acyl-carrier-protein] dehydratase